MLDCIYIDQHSKVIGNRFTVLFNSFLIYFCYRYLEITDTWNDPHVVHIYKYIYNIGTCILPPALTELSKAYSHPRFILYIYIYIRTLFFLITSILMFCEMICVRRLSTHILYTYMSYIMYT